MWWWSGVVYGFVTFPVENSVNQGVTATNCHGNASWETGGARAATRRPAPLAVFGLEAAVIRVGRKTPPATTRGGAK